MVPGLAVHRRRAPETSKRAPRGSSSSRPSPSRPPRPSSWPASTSPAPSRFAPPTAPTPAPRGSWWAALWQFSLAQRGPVRKASAGGIALQAIAVVCAVAVAAWAWLPVLPRRRVPLPRRLSRAGARCSPGHSRCRPARVRSRWDGSYRWRRSGGLGLVSYGVYLWHVPVYWVLTSRAHRTRRLRPLPDARLPHADDCCRLLQPDRDAVPVAAPSEAGGPPGRWHRPARCRSPSRSS